MSIVVNGKEFNSNSKDAVTLSNEDFAAVRELYSQGCRQRLCQNETLMNLVKKGVLKLLPIPNVPNSLDESFISESHDLIQELVEEAAASLVYWGHYEPEDVKEMAPYVESVMRENASAVLDEYECYQNEHLQHPIVVTGVTLLSQKEYERNEKFIDEKGVWWWLRDTSGRSGYVVNDIPVRAFDLFILSDHPNDIIPALHCDLSGLSVKPGDELVLNGAAYTVLHDNMLLKVTPIGKAPYPEVKKILDEWYQKEFGKNIQQEEDKDR
jgi:hypothetical protein